jgi:hypothetical protein
MKERMVEFAATLDGAKSKAEAICNKDGPIGKGDRAQLMNLLGTVFQELKSNIPFYEKSFTEATEKQVQQAKTEVENFVNMKIQQTGLDALRRQSQGLGEGFKPGTELYLSADTARPGYDRPLQAGDPCLDAVTKHWRSMTEQEAADQNAFLGWMQNEAGNWILDLSKRTVGHGG